MSNQSGKDLCDITAKELIEMSDDLSRFAGETLGPKYDLRDIGNRYSLSGGFLRSIFEQHRNAWIGRTELRGAGMSPAELRSFITIQEMGLRAGRLAYVLNVSDRKLSQTIRGLRQNDRVRTLMAEHFEMPVDTLFGPAYAILVEASVQPKL